MPMYTYDCYACEETHDRVTSVDKRDEQACASCGGPLDRRQVYAVKQVGPSEDNPLVLDNGTTVVTSPAQLREWRRKHPDRYVASKSDWDRHVQRVWDRADKNAQSRGYDDVEDENRRRKEHFATSDKIHFDT